MIPDKDTRRAGIMLPILWKKYYDIGDEDDPIAIEILKEIDYVQHLEEGYIECSYHPSEGCSQCKFERWCEL